MAVTLNVALIARNCLMYNLYDGLGLNLYIDVHKLTSKISDKLLIKFFKSCGLITIIRNLTLEL